MCFDLKLSMKSTREFGMLFGKLFSMIFGMQLGHESFDDKRYDLQAN